MRSKMRLVSVAHAPVFAPLFCSHAMTRKFNIALRKKSIDTVWINPKIRVVASHNHDAQRTFSFALSHHLSHKEIIDVFHS